MTEEDQQETPTCRAFKRGRVDLHCELPRDHDGWHQAAYRERTEADYDGAHHVVELAEIVDWKPTDDVGEAARLITKGRAER